MDIYAQRSGLNRLPLQAGTVRRLDGVRADSNKGVLHLQQTHTQANNIAIGRLGVDDQQPINGSTDGVLRILSVSSIIGVKRVNLIAEALKGVSRTVRWTHIGDGDLRDDLEEIIETLPSNINVELKGWIPNYELMNWIEGQTFDLFMNVSSYEGLPVSIMEAFSFSTFTTRTLTHSSLRKLPFERGFTTATLTTRDKSVWISSKTNGRQR